MNPWSSRHASVRHFEPLFVYGHLPAALQSISAPFAELALQLLERVPDDNPELSVALRKLLEAKDAAVRAYMISAEAR